MPVDVACGASYDFSCDHVRAHARAKLRLPDFSHGVGKAASVYLRALPEPCVGFKTAWRLPGPSGVALQLHAQAGAGGDGRVHLRLFMPPSSGPHLTAAGLVLDENVVKLGETGWARLRAALLFPTTEGLEAVDLRVGPAGVGEWARRVRLRIESLRLVANLP